jgi:PPOX class probable FMN-dependent enzyme
MNIDSIESLRSLYAAPGERAVKKQLAGLDPHCRRFIALSPFAVLSSASADMAMDASPRGGDPGFIKSPDEQTLLIPDSPGNNRLDTLQNIVATGRLGVLLLVPGVDETLRINGKAALTTDAQTLALFADSRRPPKLVIRLTVAEAYLHCAKALMRSKLWDAERHVDRALLPSMGEMIRDQTGGQTAAENQEQMLARYNADL